VILSDERDSIERERDISEIVHELKGDQNNRMNDNNEILEKYHLSDLRAKHLIRKLASV